MFTANKSQPNYRIAPGLTVLSRHYFACLV